MANALNGLLDTVVCADALSLLRGLPDGSVDIVVTSPPYNIKRKNKQNFGIFQGDPKMIFQQIGGGYQSYYDDMPEVEYQAWLHQVVTECLRVSKGLVWVNHKTRYREGVAIHPLHFLTFPLWSEIIWNRRSGIMFNARRFNPSHEFIYGFGRPHYWNDQANALFTVWDMPLEVSNEHPCPYPEQLVERLIDASCPAGGIVLDPFCGSGTTATVAQRLGRHFIGCDISESYVELARKRLQQPYTLPMFTEDAHG